MGTEQTIEMQRNEHRCCHYRNLSRLIVDRLEFIPPGCRCPRQCRFPSHRISNISGNFHNRAKYFLIYSKYDIQGLYCGQERIGEKREYFCLETNPPGGFTPVSSCPPHVQLPFQRRVCSRQEAPGDSAVPAPPVQHQQIERWRRSRRRCRR